MLFPYKYIHHDMEKMQKYIDYIFFEVWMKASKNKKYQLTIYNKYPELKTIMKNLEFSDSLGADFFKTKIAEIYEICQKYSLGQKTKLKKWYVINQNIKSLCENTICNNPLNYDNFDKFDTKLSSKLKSLYSRLYGSEAINELKEFKPYTKTIDEHYKKFTYENNKGVCPFCGLTHIKGIYHTKREAYDHYLPKGTYPFLSINFKNLSPMCHECNSSYKLENNPIFDKRKNRRKAFYPFRYDSTNIHVKVSLNTVDKTEIKPENIDIEIFSSYESETKTWIEIFGIEERYKATLSSESEGLEWLAEILDDVKNKEDLTKDDALKTIKKSFERNPFAQQRFLKVPFLEACQNAGIIS